MERKILFHKCVEVYNVTGDFLEKTLKFLRENRISFKLNFSFISASIVAVKKLAEKLKRLSSWKALETESLIYSKKTFRKSNGFQPE